MGGTAGEGGSSTGVVDLDADSLAHCAGKMGLRDLASMAASCKALRAAAYSDSVWRRLFRECWPAVCETSFSQMSGVRDDYIARHIALRQFKFEDPFMGVFVSPTPFNHLLLDKEAVIFAEGTTVKLMKPNVDLGEFSFKSLGDHKSRITCMRQFPVKDTSLFRSEAENNDNFFVTSSCDRTIRLWWKGRCQRCLRGHNGPVGTIADKLVEDCGGKLLASGGEDGTVRLWSLSSTAKRGQHALKTTLYGHEKPVVLLSVSGFNNSRLVSVSKDAKVRVWDTNSSSATRSSQCLGMTCVNGDPVGLKCHELICYVAAGCFVTAIDFRTMRKVSTIAVDQSKLHSLEILPSKSLICTGGSGKAMLWDIRKGGEMPEPVAELDGHEGYVSHIHMDSCRIVTGGPRDSFVKIWETDTGKETNSLSCSMPGEMGVEDLGLSAMAVNGYRIVTSYGSFWEGPSFTYYRDFTHSSEQLPHQGTHVHSKFWEEGISFDET